MKKPFQLLLILLLMFIPVLTYAQDCTDYHQYHCLYADYSFFYSKQSKSSLFKPGQVSELKVVAYGGEDYYVAVCAHRKFGDVHFRIIEDNSARKVIYDNATDNYSESIIFSNDMTRNLIIEVSVPENDAGSNERRCVGVVIQFRKTE